MVDPNFISVCKPKYLSVTTQKRNNCRDVVKEYHQKLMAIVSRQ